MQVQIAGLTPESIVDGPGFRLTVFTQGCPHRCPGCHNPQSWDSGGGDPMEIEEIFKTFCENPLLRGITFSGGEPFLQPEPLVALAKWVHQKGKDVFCYSGYTYEELLAMQSPGVAALLQECDVLVDGRYNEAERNLELRFRGSENQRLIDLAKTRETGQLVLFPDT